MGRLVEGKDDEGGREGGRERGYCHRNLMCEFVITRITHTVRVVCCVRSSMWLSSHVRCIRVQCAFGAHVHRLQVRP